MNSRQPKFPRYDDVWHIDSNAVAKKAPARDVRPSFSDPSATAYTEMYCQPTHILEQPDCHEYRD